jgi:hypothetical protein
VAMAKEFPYSAIAQARSVLAGAPSGFEKSANLYQD